MTEHRHGTEDAGAIVEALTLPALLTEFKSGFRVLKLIGVTLLVFVAACIALSAGVLMGEGRDAQVVNELTRRVNKLRAEVAVRDARFQASKGVAQSSGSLGDLLRIQEVVDAYALEEMRNGAASEKTSDEVRREVCDRLAASGFPCVP